MDLCNPAATPPVVNPSFQLLNAKGESPFLFVCDHASNHVPQQYQGLGLPPGALTRHIAYDIGAGEVTAALSAKFDAPAVLAKFSRLLIDANRGEDDPTLIMALSDGAVIPGNHKISSAEQAQRLATYFTPYHEAIDQALDRIVVRNVEPLLISIHSFTPYWRGIARPWHCGILWNKDGRIALPLRDALRAQGDLIVGDNEPYDGELEGDCMDRHGTRRGIAHVLIELRQDLIADAQGVAEWCERLGRALSPLAVHGAPTAP